MPSVLTFGFYNHCHIHFCPLTAFPLLFLDLSLGISLPFTPPRPARLIAFPFLGISLSRCVRTTCPPPPAGGRRTSAGRRRRATPPPDRPTHRYTGRCLTRHRVTVCNHDATHGCWDGKQPNSAKIDHQIYISLCTWRLSASNVSRFCVHLNLA